MSTEEYKLLKEDILSSFGKKIIYGKDCVVLAKQIHEKTRRQISSSTVKRFFGLIKSRFNPSQYSLDTFAIFLGFKNWLDYKEKREKTNYQSEEDVSWSSLQKQLQIITLLSMSSLKQKTGYNPQKTVSRTFAEKKIREFRDSAKIVAMVIAPDGYGKSTLMIQLAEKIILRKDANFSNDIVTLIDGSIFFNLFAKNPNNELLNQLLDFKINFRFHQYLKQYQGEEERKFWIIIDSIDEIFSDRERYYQFVENLIRFIMSGDNGWYKIILTCRPENTDIFTWLFQRNPGLKNYWFNTEFDDGQLRGAANIPAFNKNEIEKILTTHNFVYDYKYLRTHYKEVLDIIRNPYLLSLFVAEFSDDKKISEITLLKRYILRRLNSPPYLEEKREIINTFIELCNKRKETSSVLRDKLFARINRTPAYRELVAYGMLYEYVIPGETLYINTYIKFRQNIIFEYLIFENWRHNRPLTSELFFKIRDFYQNNIQLQCNLLKFFIHFLILENKYDSIRKIHAQFEKKINSSVPHSEKTPCLRIFASVIKEALQTDPHFRENLKPWLLRTRIGKLYYAES